MITEQTPINGRENLALLPSPLQALSQFYTAFNNRDLDLMAKNWAQTEDIAMDNPVGGIKRGWEEILAVYASIFNSPAEVSVEFFDYSFHQHKELFYVVGRERGEFRLGETQIPLAIRTTRIFKLINDQWRQVHHHGSFDDPEILAAYQRAVRKP